MVSKSATFIESSETNPGVRLLNGSYTGQIGVIQRDEADICVQLVRADVMDDEPVRLGPVVAPADAIILSTPLTNSSREESHITDVIYEVTSTTYSMVFEILILVMTILCVAELMNQKRFKLRHVYRRLLKEVDRVQFNTIGLILDQENYSTTTKTSSIM